MADHAGGGRDGAGSDRLDAWLDEPVRPLLPPPGAFEQVRHRARRRKLRQTALSAAGVAVLVTVGITVPRLVVPHLRPNEPVANGRPAFHHTPPARHFPSSVPSRLAKSQTPAPKPPPTTAGLLPVPGSFQVYSVTFIGTTGWVLGQAGTPGSCGPPNRYICTSIARTPDAGHRWYGVPAPVTGPPDGAHGVGQLRFAVDGQDGWAFGPELWATHDAGHRWSQVHTNGLRVTALETRGGRAFAVWAHCGGTLLGAVAGCTGYSLYSASDGSDQWKRVPGTDGISLGGSPSLVLTGGSVYLLTPGGTLLSGTGAGRLRPAGSGGVPAPAPCGPTQNGGQPPHALLATTGSGLALLCPGTATGDSQPKPVYYSGNGGATWYRAGTAPSAGIATSLAGTPNGALVLGTSHGIEMSAIRGGPWRAASWRPAGGGAVPGGFSYVGMTSELQGVAIPVNKDLHAVWFTYDSGQRWTASPVR